MRPGHPAAAQALFQAFGERLNGSGLLGPVAALGNHSDEHSRGDEARGLQASVFLLLRFKKTTEIVRHREHAAFSVLGRLGVEPHFAPFEVHLTPFERQHFRRNAPAGDVGELDHRTQMKR